MVGALKKKDWFLIGLIWLATQLAIVFSLGITDHGEATNYLILSGKWMAGQRHFDLNAFLYAGYVAIQVLFRMAGLPVKGMYFFQLLLSALALYYFIKTLSLWDLSRVTLILSAILYSTCFITQKWVSYLFTDSVFFNLLTISIYFLLAEEKGKRQKIIFWILLIVLPFFRPIGFLFTLLAILYWLFYQPKKNILRISVGLAYLCFTSLLVYKALTQSPGFFNPEHNVDATVICGYPGDLVKYQRTPYHEGMSQLAYFYANPGMTIRLFSYRSFKVFSMTRPYYSTTHNGLLTLSTLLYYFLALIGLFKVFAQKEKKKYFLIAGVPIFSAPSVLLCVDWSGRFSLPVYCFVFLFTAIGLDSVYRKFYSRRSGSSPVNDQAT